MMKITKRKKITLIILGGIIGLSFILYKPLINYLSEQAANPRGIIGEITTKIWSSYFEDLSKWTINNGTVKLSIQDVALMNYQADFFDLVYAIQTHMYWDNPQEGFEEIYRVMSQDGVLILSSEKDKIDYHMDEYKTTASLTALLKEIGFREVVEKERGNWVLYTVRK
ncbi:methyltransferase domain-containing protein [Listeria monocytogenes]|nr:methyltransferase domain-containing protein [Listeria monocytogenes]EIM1742492.1 methyltransferase domain-containing protein [Listeria monocytogenes]EIM1742639.1 methyltransferase domain-containing protein [Listeria monocytogenes]